MNRLVLGVVCCALAFPAFGQTIRFDCGGEGFAVAQLVFRRDRPYAPGGSGYVGGRAEGGGQSGSRVDGTPLRQLFAVQRQGVHAYRFDVPAGTYSLELHLAETRLHGPGQRVFSVIAEGASLLAGFDIFALVEKNYAVFYRFPVTVVDGTLDVVFTSEEEQALIAGIGIVPASADAIAPPPPAAFAATGSYRRTILTWRPEMAPDVAGYVVERAPDPSGPYTSLTLSPHPLVRFFDDDVAAGETWFYQVRTVDLWGNESGPTPALPATVRFDDDSTLPIYRLTVEPDDLAVLQENPFADDYVPGVFEHNGVVHEGVGIRFRGNVTRNMNKKSWKVNFPGAAPFVGLDKLNLNAEANDTTMLKEKICYEFLLKLNVRAPQASFAHVQVNDEYRGVFSRIDNVDLEFLDRRGLDTSGNLYKADSFVCGFETLPSEDDYRRAWDKKSNEDEGYDDLIEMLETVNSTPDDEFLLMIARLFDVDALLDYYATVVLTSNFDHVFHNYYVYHDLERGIWELLPKDWNGTFGDVEFAVDYGTVNSPGGPGGGDASNVLMTRVLDVPELRLRYADKLLELLDGPFSSGVLDSRMDDAFAEIADDARLDVYKIGSERNEIFQSGPTQLKEFIARRTAWLRPEAENYRPEITQQIFINELNAVDDWIEIYNAGQSAIDLTDHSLTDNLNESDRWIFPPGTVIEPGAHLLIENALALSRNGETIGLFGPQSTGSALLDFITCRPQNEHSTFGRRHDGSALWSLQGQPTPGEPNIGPGNTPPVIWGLDHSPASPEPFQEMTLTAVIEDDGIIVDATLMIDIGGGWTATPLADDGFTGDEAADDGLHGAIVPGMAPGTVVRYYFEATDEDGLTTRRPSDGEDAPLVLTLASEPGDIVLNELQADNENTIADEAGEYDDWIELYNRGAEPVDLSGAFLSDDLVDPEKWQIPEGTIVEPGAHLLIWADDDEGQGPLHANFKLSANGEGLYLYGNDSTLLDSVEFPAQAPDVAWARQPDGGETWTTAAPTPGRANSVAPRRGGRRVGG